MKNKIAQTALDHSLKNLAAQLDLCAQHFANISRQVDELSQKVHNASYISAPVADSCLSLLQEICASGMNNAKRTFMGNATASIIASCMHIKQRS